MNVQQETYSSGKLDEACSLLFDASFLEAYAAATKLLGVCFAYSPKEGAASRALAAIRAMDVAADWPFGEGGTLANAASLIEKGVDENPAELAEEYQRLFVGPRHLAAPPWGSVYMDHDKVLYGCTWVELRDWMRARGVNAEYDEHVPEDQIGRLLVMSAEVAREKIGVLPELLGNHILPWAGHYFDLLAGEARSATYEGLALLAKATLDDTQSLLGIAPAKRRLYR